MTPGLLPKTGILNRVGIEYYIMKKLHISKFKSSQLPKLSELNVKGGISCHDASVIMEANVQADGESIYCGMTIQCDGNDSIPGVC